MPQSFFFFFDGYKSILDKTKYYGHQTDKKVGKYERVFLVDMEKIASSGGSELDELMYVSYHKM